MDSIVLGGKNFTYQIIRKPIRSLNIRLKSSKSFVVSCPRLTPDFIVKKFIDNQSSWILKHSPKIAPKRRLSNLTSLRILGEKYLIVHNKLSSKPLKVDQFNRQIIIRNSSALKTGLRPLALQLVKSELKSIQEEFPFTYCRVTVRNQKTRFGSCSSTGSLNFNWQIILFPRDMFRHVLFHEIAHLKVKNHSKDFWNLLAQYDPHWRVNNHWLKKEGAKCFIV